MLIKNCLAPWSEKSVKTSFYLPKYDSEEFDYDSEEPDYDSEEFLRKDALDDLIQNFTCVKTRSGVCRRRGLSKKKIHHWLKDSKKVRNFLTY